MQSVHFNSLTEFFEFLPDEERLVTHLLRDLVYETLPEIKEKLSFNVPFFRQQKTICFIWPGAVLWGSKRSYEGVRMGFNYGHLLDPKEEILSLEKRKSVAYLDLLKPEEIPFEQIRELLLRSAELDQKKR